MRGAPLDSLAADTLRLAWVNSQVGQVDVVVVPPVAVGSGVQDVAFVELRLLSTHPVAGAVVADVGAISFARWDFDPKHPLLGHAPDLADGLVRSDGYLAFGTTAAAAAQRPASC